MPKTTPLGGAAPCLVIIRFQAWGQTAKMACDPHPFPPQIKAFPPITASQVFLSTMPIPLAGDTSNISISRRKAGGSRKSEPDPVHPRAGQSPTPTRRWIVSSL